MKKLIPNVGLDCENLKDFAFGTHVDCYLNPGYPAKSFCEIAHEFENMIALMRTYEFSDFLSKQALEQVKIELSSPYFKFNLKIIFVLD